MLEEYLCMGGNEVANNARTYAYAMTAGCPLTWFQCIPCEAIHSLTSNWTFPEWDDKEVGRNFITNPSFEVNATGISNEETDQTSMQTIDQAYSGSYSLLVERTVDGDRTVAWTDPATVNETLTYSLSVYVYSSVATNAVVSISWRLADGLTVVGVTDSLPQAVPAGTWTRIVGTGTAPATAARAVPQVTVEGLVVADVLYVDAAQFEETAAPTEYFDGSTAADTSQRLTYSWSAAPGLSESIKNQLTITVPGSSDTPEYDYANISDAPWYDADEPDLTSRFYGPFILSIEGLSGSTRSASVTEGILDGGVVGLVRNTTREMRVRALLTGLGEDALEYGVSWLSAVLGTDGCSQHGNACGAVDISFLSYCPDPLDPTAPPEEMLEEYLAAENAFRTIHNVTVTSGPLVTDKIKSSDKKHYAYIVEWTMVAGTPWVFSPTREIDLNPATPVVVQDTPFNLIPYPSAELYSGSVVTATNYSTNPSVETDATGWAKTQSSNVTAANVTAARSTALSAVGSASYRVLMVATNSGTAGWIAGQQAVTLPSLTNARYSINMWSAFFVNSGTAVISDVTLLAIWSDGGGTLRTDTLGSIPATGGALSGASIQPPAGATTVTVRAQGNITSWSSGANIALFVDALAVTVP